MSKRHFEKKSNGGIISGKECIYDTFNPVSHLCEVFSYCSTTSFFIPVKKLCCYFPMFLSECGIVLILGNQEKALAVRSSVLEHLSSKSCDAELVVSKLKETLRLDQASLEQPDSDTKKQIRCLAREAIGSNRPDVVEYLREITPAGTTGECFSVFLMIIPRRCSVFT